jgi:cation:H+ antiporter
MVFIIFILAAIFTVLAAVKLSTYADVLSERTSLGGMLIGTIFLAGATSLPEVTTSLTAIGLNNPDLAVGGVLGSNLFNLLIIASFDLYFRKKQIFKGASESNLYTIYLGMLLSFLIFLALTLKLPYSLFGVGVDSLILLVVYISGMYILSKKMAGSENGREHEDAVPQTSAISLKRAITGFSIAAIVILITGSLLSITGDKIAVVTGLGSSFVGSFLIAASTSLPEAVSVLIAIQLRNYNLAIGSILGSNLFNILILIGTDVMYRPATIISTVSSVHLITALATFILSMIVLYSLLRFKLPKLQTVYWLPSALLVIVYFVSSFLIFNY